MLRLTVERPPFLSAIRNAACTDRPRRWEDAMVGAKDTGGGLDAAAANLTERLGQCYSGAIYDVMRDMGRPGCVLPRTIRAIDPDTRVFGRVFTVRGRPDDTISAHESLIAWTEFLT